MNTSEMVARVRKIDDEILRLESERDILTAEIEKGNHHIIFVGNGGYGMPSVERLVNGLNALAIEDSFPRHRFLLFLNQLPDFTALVADAIEMSTLSVGILADVKIKSKIASTNQKEIRRLHQFFAKYSSKAGIRKRARGYF